MAPTVELKKERPSVFCPELAEVICKRLAAGENLRAFCVWPSWPTKSTVIRWTKENPAFAERYRNILRARPNQFQGVSAPVRAILRPRARAWLAIRLSNRAWC